MTDCVLKINKISVAFEGFLALSEVTCEVKRNTIHFFIGPNGAGKTTLLDIICGKTKQTYGQIYYYPEEGKKKTLTGMREYQIVQAGIGRKFQVPSVFQSLTVYDNMELSLKGNKKVLDSIFYKVRPEERATINEVLELVNLKEKYNTIAGYLSHGEKQWLEIAMQLVQKPSIILLDEPAAGMGKPETAKTGQILQNIRQECTVIVIEHDMQFVRQVADAVTVLHEGRILLEGNIDEVLADQTVQAVYLGRGGERDAAG